jgi:hypothetical protein
LRVYTNTEVPKPIREASQSETDESFDYDSGSDTDMSVDNLLLSNPSMPIYDVATGTLEHLTVPPEIEKKEIIGIQSLRTCSTCPNKTSVAKAASARPSERARALYKVPLSLLH